MKETGGEVVVGGAASGIIWDGQKRGKSEREGGTEEEIWEGGQWRDK